jgi:hypothetical protein
VNSLSRKTYALIGLLLLGSFALLLAPPVAAVRQAWMAMVVCSAGLTVAFLYFLWRQRSAAEKCRVEINPRKAYIVQGLTQGSIFFYVGHYWSGMDHWAPFVIYQLLIAFIFDFLVYAYRENRYPLGLQILPIVMSINLFMWFKPEYFAGQIAMVLLGILGKAYVVRTLDGRRRHIYNPSVLPMVVMAILVVFLFSGERYFDTNNVVSSYLLPPHFQVFVFTAGLIAHLVGGTSFISLGAVVTLFVIDRMFKALVGLPPTGDLLQPSVFIGITLLATDPVTMPKTRTGQLIAGVLYGLGIDTFYVLLNHFGFARYYDKLLPIPFLNYLAPYLDRIKVPLWGPMKSPVWARNWAPAALWGATFLAMVPTVERNFLRRAYFVETDRAAAMRHPERRFPLDRDLGRQIQQRIAQRCQTDPTLEACRLVDPRMVVPSP